MHITVRRWGFRLDRQRRATCLDSALQSCQFESLCCAWLAVEVFGQQRHDCVFPDALKFALLVDAFSHEVGRADRVVGVVEALVQLFE